MRSWLTYFLSKATTALGVARFQIKSALANVEELMPILSIPLYTLAALAVLISSDRADLAPYALVASFLMTVTQMVLFVVGDILYNEEAGGMLELHIAAPSSYPCVVYLRSIVISAISLVGLVESDFIASVVFDLDIKIEHPIVFILTIFLTLVCAANHGMLLSAALSTSVSPRTYQNVISGPMFLVGGVLVPVMYLPDWLSFFSPLVFLSWTAELLRGCYEEDIPLNYEYKLLALLLISVLSGAFASFFFRRRVQDLIDFGGGVK